MNEQIKIKWYRSKVDRSLMSELMKSNDARAFAHVLAQLGLFCLTGTLAYLAFLNVSAGNWPWAVPLLLLALFVHGTFSSFLGLGGPVHELCHKTPFRTKAWNEFFLKLYSFLSWTDYVAFRPSHVKHHQATVHEDYDGEVVLPQRLDWQSVMFFFNTLVCSFQACFLRVRIIVYAALGEPSVGLFPAEWMKKILPESNPELRREHRRWARILLLGHLTLAVLFIASGHWFLIVIFNFGTFYCGWLTMLCGTPQHIGLQPNVPDFRLCCRTYTCSRFIGFFYWNMQYHVEHHMFPAVPFYNLPRLREAIAYDLPPATHGLWATWKEILRTVKRQREDPSYCYIPELPTADRHPVEREVDEGIADGLQAPA